MFPSHRRALEQRPYFFSFQVESHQRSTHPRLLICAISIPSLSPHQATESQQRPYFLSSCEIVSFIVENVPNSPGRRQECLSSARSFPAVKLSRLRIGLILI